MSVLSGLKAVLRVAELPERGCWPQKEEVGGGEGGSSEGNLRNFTFSKYFLVTKHWL